MITIKVLVVDDSAFMRKVITDLVQKDGQIQVVATARDGQNALQKIAEHKPDVVTLDVEMPVMNGLETLDRIREISDAPVVMLSSVSVEGADITLSCLEKGAFDFVSKPSGSISLDLFKVQSELIQKIKLAHQSQLSPAHKRVDFVANKNRFSPSFKKKTSVCHPTSTGLKQMILIGTSTGGPKALDTLFKQLPVDSDTAILVVQHMPPTFTKQFAQRLNTQTSHSVKEGEDGELILPGTIYIAPGGYHMAIKEKNFQHYVHLHQQEPIGGHRPSVNVLFESVACINNIRLITILLTGMGKDGTEGLKNLRKLRHAHHIAEDASTCVVFGMPKTAIEANLIDEVIPLNQIPEAINRLFQTP